MTAAGHRARKRFGQHWLVDERVLDRIRHRQEIGVGFVAVDFTASRIDRDDPAGVAVLAQKTLRARSVFCFIAGYGWLTWMREKKSYGNEPSKSL